MGKLFVDGSKLMHHLDELSLWKNGQLDSPIHVEISPSSGCNQRCNLCCVDYLGHKLVQLPETTMKKLPKEMKFAGVKSVLLAGEGEPLLNPNTVSLIEEAAKESLDMALNSNGVLLTKDVSDRILDKLVWARFSLQASNPDLYQTIHGTSVEDYETFCSNIRYAVEFKKKKNLKVTLGIQQILINENQADLFETAKLAKELGVDYYIVKRFSKHPKNTYDVPEDLYLACEEEFKKIETLSTTSFKAIVRWNNFTKDCHRNYKKCIGLPFISQILANGEIYPCAQFFHQKDYCFGNINESSFSEILAGSKSKQIQKKIETDQDVNQCMSYCRHHSTNQFLWGLYEGPEHVNFI